MTEKTVNAAAFGGVADDAPPPGTAIVRPLHHVKVVRDRHAQQLAERSLGPESRSARAWSWALGESDAAPVTDRVTAVPPGRSDMAAEIAVADERRLRGDREKRADGAATILRWLIGEDDHVPVRGPNPGELVGGFGDIVRSACEIVERLASSSTRGRRAQHDEPDYVNGIIATLRWTIHEEAAAPISAGRTTPVTARDLKAERVLAEDVIEQHHTQASDDLSLPPIYAAGIASAISWLLGESTTLNTLVE